MTDRKQEQNTDKKVKVDKLALSKETVEDLTEPQAERVEGGAAGERCRGSNLTQEPGGTC